MLSELASVGVQGAEDASLDTELASVPEHGAGSAAKKVVEQEPIFVEERPQQMRHSKGDMLPVAEGVAVFVEIAAQAVVMLEQQLCGARDIHDAESTGRQRAGKVHRRQLAHVAEGSFYAGGRCLREGFGVFSRHY